MQANYCQQYFKHIRVIPTRGKPNYKSLYTLHAQIKSNIKSVSSVLGGRKHGLLESCLFPQRYNHISLVLFILTVDPEASPIQQDGMRWEIM